MHRVIILGCSKAKLGYPEMASRIYTGVVWQAWRLGLSIRVNSKELQPCSKLPSNWALLVLSAKHGLLRAWDSIDPYDQRLTPARSEELAPLVRSQWERYCKTRVDPYARRPHPQEPVEVAIIAGDAYQGLAKAAGLPVVARIDGSPGGIGELRQRAKQAGQAIAHHRNRELYGDTAWRELKALAGEVRLWQHLEVDKEQVPK